MKILQLCIRVPYPPVDGGSIAMYNLAKGLYDNGAQIKVLAFNTIKQFVDLNSIDAEFKSISGIEAVPLDNRVKPWGAFMNLFSNESYNVVRFIDEGFEKLLIRVLQEDKFDIIQLESLYMFPYVDIIRKHSKAKVILRTHNIEYQIWQRIAVAEKNPLKKIYLNLLTRRLKKYEIQAVNKVDALIPLTQEDAHELKEIGGKSPVFVAPIGINIQDYPVSKIANKIVIFHLGPMDWIPNKEGITWFLEKVWPLLKKDFPELQLRLAGKKMPEEFFKYADDFCEINGFVPDAKKFISEGSIMIVPLFSGSGMRVKIIEGMAMGKVMVSTKIGMEGIPGLDGEHMVIAGDVNQFREKIGVLLRDPAMRERIGKNARKFVTEHFDNHEIGKKLMTFYRDLIK